MIDFGFDDVDFCDLWVSSDGDDDDDGDDDVNAFLNLYWKSLIIYVTYVFPQLTFNLVPFCLKVLLKKSVGSIYES